MVNRRPLLGRLAALGWFKQNGELAATQALTMLLDDDVLHHAFVGYAEELIGTALPGIRVFEAERSHEGFGRPDIESVDAQRQVVMIVEGKFWAPLEVAQVDAYLAHLRQNCSPGRRTGFLVLLPESRESETVGRGQGSGPLPLAYSGLVEDLSRQKWDRAQAAIYPFIDAFALPLNPEDVDEILYAVLTHADSERSDPQDECR